MGTREAKKGMSENHTTWGKKSPGDNLANLHKTDPVDLSIIF